MPFFLNCLISCVIEWVSLDGSCRVIDLERMSIIVALGRHGLVSTPTCDQ